MEREHGLTGSCREGQVLLLTGGGGSLGRSCGSWGDDIRVAGEGAGNLETGGGQQLLILLLLELELVTVSSLEKIEISSIYDRTENALAKIKGNLLPESKTSLTFHCRGTKFQQNVAIICRLRGGVTVTTRFKLNF